ncbi:MAG: phosphohydrolase [Blastocatellia bacterium AA13]|nr:MAG: phosphohydrolase [Blastocatellia bacterium AA13]
MRVFAIGDMHLAGGSDKTMDRFGSHWVGHDLKIFGSWEALAEPDDLLIIAGDTSWAMRLAEAIPDLSRIGSMRGRKLLIKGNHDYWWQSESRLKQALDPSIEPLQSRSIIINRVAIAATRGWLCPNERIFTEADDKIYNREVGRLQRALDVLRHKKSDYDALIVALHYPPVNSKHVSSGFTDLIEGFHADYCVYGHLHGDDIRGAFVGKHGDTTYHLVSADAVNFTPALILSV